MCINKSLYPDGRHVLFYTLVLVPYMRSPEKNRSMQLHNPNVHKLILLNSHIGTFFFSFNAHVSIFTVIDGNVIRRGSVYAFVNCLTYIQSQFIII